MLRAICRDASGWRAVHDLSTISDLINESRTLVWAFADVAELADDLPTIAEEFSLDPLAFEDAMNLRQRPKVESYPNHLFAVMHQIDEVDGQFEARQIACYVGRRWVLTLHESSQRTIDETIKRLQDADVLGPPSVMHALLDTIVDEYERLADDLEATTEDVEARVLADPVADVRMELYSMKQRLSRLRRYTAAGERVLGTFVEQNQIMPQDIRPLFRDVHDHTQRILEQTENVDAILDAVIDLQRSAHADALNETTKRLTGWAAIIAVPTLIASVYGMNFALVPDEGSLGGFGFALGLMTVTGVSLFAYFKRRGWI